MIRNDPDFAELSIPVIIDLRRGFKFPGSAKKAIENQQSLSANLLLERNVFCEDKNKKGRKIRNNKSKKLN